ncbi:hypothetical protein [[Muricauda] lutisoli]|uniref:Uncharacterized protein n=1 Tax=[Muricauda] lutisoli TaxID=2816035 RepID=A0ABS3EW81_9FLAO|nr:hypothetical protein [[Muricauda] lutisoli]MBO0330398.1 hypothetical protein [[Muricauda] lutisoli]
MFNYRKTLNLILALVLLASCTENTAEENDIVKSSDINETSLTIRENGKFHNEAILSILDKSKFNDPLITTGEVLKLMYYEMSSKYPDKFHKTDLSTLDQVFDFDQKYSDFKFDSEFYESLKSKIGKNNIEQNILSFLDKAFYEGQVTEKEFVAFDTKTGSSNIQIEIFKSYYEASEILWTQDAGKTFAINPTAKCDAASQVIIADAVGGTLIGILTGGAGGPLGGGAVSLAVRQAQIEEYGGGCIE